MSHLKKFDRKRCNANQGLYRSLSISLANRYSKSGTLGHSWACLHKCKYQSIGRFGAIFVSYGNMLNQADVRRND